MENTLFSKEGFRKWLEQHRCSCARPRDIREVVGDIFHFIAGDENEGLLLRVEYVFEKDCPLCKGMGYPSKDVLRNYLLLQSIIQQLRFSAVSENPTAGNMLSEAREALKQISEYWVSPQKKKIKRTIVLGRS